MSDFDIKDSELSKFINELTELQEVFPKEAMRLMRTSGTKARTIVAKKARQLVKKKTGNYLKSIKRGRVWLDSHSGEIKIRVYTRSPHGHLIEFGHRIVGKDGVEHGFKEGYHVFDRASSEIEEQWTQIVIREFDKIMDKL